MDIPRRVHERLRLEFGGRLRIRFSVKEKNFHVEQKIHRPVNPPCKHDPFSDRLIRTKDGYGLVCKIQPGDRMACPDCNMTLKVPVLTFGEVTCQWCGFAGRSGSWFAGFFPLDSEALFEHLRRIDPERGGVERVEQDMLAHDAAKVKREQREFNNEVEDITKDAFTEMFQIQSVGHTGKEASWIQE